MIHRWQCGGSVDAIYCVVIIMAWTAGGFISGVTSMGCSLVAMPILCLAMSPDRAVLLCSFCGGVVPALLVPVYRRGVIVRELLLLLGASLPGCLLGGLVFTQIPAQKLNLALGLMLGGVVIWQIWGSGVRVRLRDYGVVSVAAGFMGGLLGALAGAPGAALGVYASLRTWDKESMLSMQSAYYAFCAVMVVGMQWKLGLYTREVVCDIAWAVPGALGGIALSLPARRLISAERARQFLLALLGVSALLLCGKGLWG